MKDIDRLSRSGYKYNPLSGSWIRLARKAMLVIVIHRGEGAALVINAGRYWQNPSYSISHPTVRKAIAAGEAFLAERASERRAARAAPE